jgi:Fringe-like
MPRRNGKRLWFFLIISVCLVLSIWNNRDTDLDNMISNGLRKRGPRPAGVARGQTYFHTYPDNNRYMAGDTWRPPDSFGQIPVKLGSSSNKRNTKPTLHHMSRGEHLQQALAEDHIEIGERVFLLIKTGASVLWDRLPMHFLTTVTRFPNFALYSDAADSIGGYEVIDILANVSQSLLLYSEQFQPYRDARRLRSSHLYVTTKESGIKGGWILDKFKNIRILEHAYKQSPDMDWYMLIDDDTIVLADNLSRFLKSLDPNALYYLGSAVAGLDYIFAHGGSGIVLSRGLMKRAFGAPQSDEWVAKYTERTERECCGDYMVAVYLKETVGVSLNFEVSAGRFQGEPIWAIPTSANNWCQEVITMHHQAARDLEMIWEYERLKGPEKSILYSDIYNDFQKPYLPDSARLNWDNGAREAEFSWIRDLDGGIISPDHPLDNSKPYYSLSNCRKECEDRADCLMYRYDPYALYCGISKSSVALGRPILEYDEESLDNRLGSLNRPFGRKDDQKMVSGWYLDRVVAMRKTLECDGLHHDSQADGQVDGIRDQMEGWWLRAKTRYPDAIPDPLKVV